MKKRYLQKKHKLKKLNDGQGIITDNNHRICHFFKKGQVVDILRHEENDYWCKAGSMHQWVSREDILIK